MRSYTWVTAAIVALSFGGLVAAAYVISRMEDVESSGILIAALFAFLTPTISSLLVALKGDSHDTQIDDVRKTQVVDEQRQERQP